MGGERKLFHHLEGDPGELSVSELQDALEEIASGTGSFGPLEEWNDWFHYLLGQLIPRCHEAFVDSLLEYLITAFLAVHPNGIGRAPYAQFQSDALLTLGRCMMEPRCWNGNEIAIGEILHRRNDNPAKTWGWWDASGDFTASLHFCMKYLDPSLVRGWFTSVLAIESPHWRAQVLVWLVGAKDTLDGLVTWPSELGEQSYPAIEWAWSFCLRGGTYDDSGLSPVRTLLPEPSRAAVLEVTRAYFTEDVFLEWLESIARVPYLESELADIPSSFERLYLGRAED